MGIGNTGAMRVTPGLPPTMRRGRRNRGSSVRRGGWTARGVDAARRRRRASNGDEENRVKDAVITMRERRGATAELPRLRGGRCRRRRGDEDDQNLEIWTIARVTTPKRRHGNTIIRKALVRSTLGSARSCTNEDIVKCFDSWAFLGLTQNSPWL